MFGNPTGRPDFAFDPSEAVEVGAGRVFMQDLKDGNFRVVFPLTQGDGYVELNANILQT